MAAKRAAQEAAAIKAVEVNGVKVEVSTAYIRSWDGLRKAARMASPDASDAEKLAVMFDYYEHAVANLDEVVEAVGGGDAEAVLAVLARAVGEAAPKN